MSIQFRYLVIDASEPMLWVAIGAATVAAVLLGRVIGRKAAANGGVRGLALAALDMVVLMPVLLLGEHLLLLVLFAMQTGGQACLPLVRHLLLLPVGVGVTAVCWAWNTGRKVAVA
jgi:hypothetical protein